MAIRDNRAECGNVAIDKRGAVRSRVSGALLFLSSFALLTLPSIAAPPQDGKTNQADALPNGAIMRLGDAGMIQPEKVQVVAFSPDGKHLASAGGYALTAYRLNRGIPPPDIYLWDVASGRLVRRFQGHRAAVTHLTFSPDGSLLSSCSEDGTARVWDVESGGQKWATARDLKFRQVQFASFSSDGAATTTGGSRGIVRVWDSRTGRHTRDIDTGVYSVHRAVYNRQDSRLSAFGYDPRDGSWRVRVWDLFNNKVLWQKSGKDRNALGEFSIDGELAAIATSDGSIAVYDVATGESVAQFKSAHSRQSSLAFSPNGTSLAQRFGGIVRIWDIETRNLAFTWKVLSSGRSLAVSSDRQDVAVGVSRHVVLADPRVNGLRLPKQGHAGGVFQMASSRDGKSSVTIGKYDDRICLWSLESGRLLASLHRDLKLPFDRNAVAVSPTTRFVAVANNGNSSIRLFHLTSGNEVEVALPPGIASIIASRFISDDRIQSITERGEVVLTSLDTKSSKLIGKLNRHVANATFSHDAKRVALRSAGKVELVEVSNNRLIWSKTLGPLAIRRAPVWSGEGDRLVASVDMRIRKDRPRIPDPFPITIWAAKDGAERQVSVHQGRVSDFAWLPDNNVIASCGQQEILVVDSATHDVQLQLGNPERDHLIRVAAKPRRLLSAGASGTVLVWAITSRESQ